MKWQMSHIHNLAMLLSLVGFFSSILLSIFFNHEETTRTHCGVNNYFPTISATIGDYSPQKEIWKFTMLLASILRFPFIYMYLTEMTRCLNDRSDTECMKSFCVIHAVLNFFEIIGLIGLSLVSSSSYFEFHRNCFIMFLACSFIYMVIHLYLFSFAVDRKLFGVLRFSMMVKRFTFVIGLFAFVLAMYYYDRHGKFCEEGVYSKFALSEYVVVLANIFFHSTISLDFRYFVFCTTECEMEDSRLKYMSSFSPIATRKRFNRSNPVVPYHYKILSGKT